MEQFYSNYTTSGTPNNIIGVSFWLPFLISSSFKARNVSPGKSSLCSLLRKVFTISQRMNVSLQLAPRGLVRIHSIVRIAHLTFEFGDV